MYPLHKYWKYFSTLKVFFSYVYFSFIFCVVFWNVFFVEPPTTAKLCNLKIFIWNTTFFVKSYTIAILQITENSR